MNNKFGKCEVNMKKGFTLAEVLITLGIIGIVAALTLPSLINKYEKQSTITAVQKVYSTLNQALKRSELDNGDSRYWAKGQDMGALEYYNQYWGPYLKPIKICKTYNSCGYKSANPWKHYNTAVVSPAARTTVIMPDGMVIIFMTATTNTSDTSQLRSNDTIIVDINGPKNPNEGGKDVFVFEKVDNNLGKGVLPYGYNREDDVVKASCSNDTRDMCATMLMRNGWKISDDYPW